MIAILILFVIENIAIFTTLIISVIDAETNYDKNEINFSKIKQPKLKDLVVNLGFNYNLEIIYVANDMGTFNALEVVLKSQEEILNFVEKNSELRVLKLNFFAEKVSIFVEGKGKKKVKK